MVRQRIKSLALIGVLAPCCFGATDEAGIVFAQRVAITDPVSITYSEIIESTRPFRTVEEQARKLEGLIDHPDYADTMRHYGLLVSPKEANCRLIYGGVHAVYHMISSSTGYTWQLGGNSKFRWSFMDPGTLPETSGDVIIVETGKPVALFRDVSGQLMSESVRIAEGILFFGVPKSVRLIESTQVDRSTTKEIYTSSNGQFFYTVMIDQTDAGLVVFATELQSGNPVSGGHPVQEYRFSDHIPVGDSSMFLPTTVSLRDYSRHVVTTWDISEVDFLSRDRAVAFFEPPMPDQFSPDEKVDFIDFSDPATIKSERYKGVPTVTWRIDKSGEDIYTYTGLPEVHADGVSLPGANNNTVDPGSRSGFTRTMAILLCVGVGLVLVAALRWRKGTQ